MSRLISMAGPDTASSPARHGCEAKEVKEVTVPDAWETENKRPISTRGILLGGLLSGLLWAAIILAVRQLWLFLR